MRVLGRWRQVVGTFAVLTAVVTALMVVQSSTAKHHERSDDCELQDHHGPGTEIDRPKRRTRRRVGGIVYGKKHTAHRLSICSTTDTDVSDECTVLSPTVSLNRRHHALRRRYQARKERKQVDSNANVTHRVVRVSQSQCDEDHTQLTSMTDSITRLQSVWRGYRCRRSLLAFRDALVLLLTGFSTTIPGQYALEASFDTTGGWVVYMQRRRQVRRSVDTITTFLDRHVHRWRDRRLHSIRKQWTETRRRRERLLQEQLQAILSVTGSDSDIQRLQHALLQWVSSVMTQIHVETIALPPASITVDTSASSILRSWLVPSQHLPALDSRQSIVHPQHMLLAVHLLQVFIRCRFARRLLAVKTRYFHGLVRCKTLVCIGYDTRAVLLIQAAWRLSTARRHWRRYITLSAIRMLLLADLTRKRRLHVLPPGRQ